MNKAATTTTRRAKPLPPAERRLAIIAAVRPLLLEYGSAITSRQIATAAGVSEGTIFNVFADKERLVDAAIDAALDIGAFDQAVTDIDRAQAFEQQLIEAIELTQRRVVDVWKLVSKVGPRAHSATQPLPESAALVQLFAEHTDALRIEPTEAARLLRALTLSLTHPLLTPTPKSPHEIVDVFMNGVAA